jgi:hypothetical protein
MTILRGVFLIAAMSAIAAAQQHTNFSGTWNFNVTESDYSDKRTSPPDRMSINIQQKGDTFKYHFELERGGKKAEFDVHVTVGGPAYESDAAGIITLAWKGDKLEISTLYNPGQDRQSDATEIWSLSSDGKKLTSDLVQRLPKNGGEVHVRRVFDKKN